MGPKIDMLCGGATAEPRVWLVTVGRFVGPGLVASLECSQRRG